jgi:hypothetical protein
LWRDTDAIENKWPKCLINNEDAPAILETIDKYMKARNKILLDFGFLSNKRFRRLKNHLEEEKISRKSEIKEKSIISYLTDAWSVEVDVLSTQIINNFDLNLLKRALYSEFKQEKISTPDNIKLFLNQTLYTIYRNRQIVQDDDWVANFPSDEEKYALNWGAIERAASAARKVGGLKARVDQILDRLDACRYDKKAFLKRRPGMLKELIVVSDRADELQGVINRLNAKDIEQYNFIYEEYLGSLKRVASNLQDITEAVNETTQMIGYILEYWEVIDSQRRVSSVRRAQEISIGLYTGELEGRLEDYVL